MKLGFLTACLPERSLDEIAGVGRGATATRRSRWRHGPRSATARSPPPTSTSRTSTRRGRRHARASRQARPDPVLAGLLRQQPAARRRRAAADQRARAAGASTPPPLLGCPTVGTFVGRDPGRIGAGEPGRRRGGVRAARRPSRRAGRQAHHRELRDGGLAPRRLPGQPRLLARAVGVDVLDRPVPQLRPVPPGVDRHRPGGGGAPLRRPHPSRPGQGHRALPRGPQPLRLSSARPSSATIRGTSAGGGTACRASARSTGSG